MITYIEKLLNGQPVEWKTLGEVAVIGTGSSNRQDEVEGGNYPFYVRSKNVLRSATYQFDETAIIIPGEGGIGIYIILLKVNMLFIRGLIVCAYIMISC